MGLKPRLKRPAGPAGLRRGVRKGRGAPAPPNHPPIWRAWQARNGGKRWYWRGPLAIEWGLEWFVDRLRSLALFDLLELAGRATILVAVAFWFLESGDRAKERHYRAWELINAARGSTGDGGRKDALQDLNRDGVSLAVAPLEQAFLYKVDLKGAVLVEANLQGAVLVEANLQGADLVDANLRGAVLRGANLQGAKLRGANLQDAVLWGANLQGAKLRGANLQGAVLVEANLQGADLVEANLRGADLVDANLRGADLVEANLRGADLQGANLGGANLQKARYLAQEQLNAANGDDWTQLPEGLTRPAHWSKAEGNEGQPAAQPDDGVRAPAADDAPGSDK